MEWTDDLVMVRRRTFHAMQRPQHALGHIAAGSVRRHVFEIHVQRSVGFACRKMQCDAWMAGQLLIRRQRLAGVAKHASVAAVPVGVIVAHVERGETTVARVGAGREREVDPVAILPRNTGFRRKPPVACKKQLRCPFMRRPVRGGAPSLLGHREVVHGLFTLEAGIESDEIVIEESQQLRKQRKLGVCLRAQWADIRPRAVIPRAKQ
jgi:hypothetical protein